MSFKKLWKRASKQLKNILKTPQSASTYINLLKPAPTCFNLLQPTNVQSNLHPLAPSTTYSSNMFINKQALGCNQALANIVGHHRMGEPAHMCWAVVDLYVTNRVKSWAVSPCDLLLGFLTEWALTVADMMGIWFLVFYSANWQPTQA